jgi:hypothetical protein
MAAGEVGHWPMAGGVQVWPKCMGGWQAYHSTTRDGSCRQCHQQQGTGSAAVSWNSCDIKPKSVVCLVWQHPHKHKAWRWICKQPPTTPTRCKSHQPPHARSCSPGSWAPSAPLT